MMDPTAAGQALLDAFDRIYVINLERRRDRLHQICAQLARLGLTFQAGKVVRFDACSFADNAGFPSAGARGCFSSHLGVIREAVDDRLSSILILEDDLDFCPDIECRLPPALVALGTSHWSLFYGAVLNTSPCQNPTSPLSMAAAHEGLMGTHFVGVAGSTLPLLDRYLTSMTLRPAGSPQGGPMHVDGAYSWFRRESPEQATFVACPGLGYQRPSKTDIHSLTWKDTLPVVRDITAVGRRVARQARSALRQSHD